MDNNNPFALIQGALDNQIISFRPVQFDSFDYDKDFKKSNGETIKPTMATTTCPKCSCVVEVLIPSDFNSTRSVLKASCSNCNQSSVVVNFPFDDPIDSLKIPLLHINPCAVTNSKILTPKPKPVIESPTPSPNDPLGKIFNPTKPMGLGEFIKSKEAWNKLKKTIDDNFSSNEVKDIFDVFSNIPESNQL